MSGRAQQVAWFFGALAGLGIGALLGGILGAAAGACLGVIVVNVLCDL